MTEKISETKKLDEDGYIIVAENVNVIIESSLTDIVE